MILNSNNIQHIIAIGASAGGMEETHAFFDHTPLDEVSYVIIQHLSPDFKSRMAELLAKHSKLKICVAEHNMRVEKNQVYMIPNKKFMTIQGGKLRLTDKEGKDSPHMTIDTFFSSLAADSGHKAIGIILSGTGTDGSLGIEAIKNAGGLILVQDPETAKFSGMPSHAISTGFADAVLSTESMPNLIKNYVKKLPWQPINDALNESSEEEEKTMSAILDLIKDQLPHDFSNYKRSTLLRRTKRRMTYNNLKGLDQYFTFIKNNPSEMEELAKDFLISVTKFFRDKEAFELLEKDIIPDIFKNHTTENALKIWVAGCATGEEAYSLAILIKEYMVSTNQELEVKIFATDIDKIAMEQASKGIYPENIALDVSKERLDRFFLREGNRYKVKEEIRRMLVIAYHDLVKNPPYCNTDLISCRNLLIYMNPLLQKKVFSMFHFGLKKGGYLFLGSSENAKINGDDFFEINKKWKIYIKKEAVRTARFNSFSLLVNEEVKPVKLPYTDSFDTSFKKIELVEKVNESIMNEFGVSGVCIDNNFNIVQNFGDLSKYLLPKMFEFNLNELLPRNLKVAVRTAVFKAQKLNGKAAIKQVHMKYNDSTYMLNLYVKPLIFSKPHLKLMLVLFREGEIESTDEIMEVFSPAQHTQAYLSDLEEELKETKENLKTTLDKVDIYNENIQSFNEELLSSNEEMQSGNEELESVNEELQTINSEHLSTIKELIILNDELNNYFRSNVSGHVIVDNDLLLKKFSPAAVKHINLRDSDIGRPIHNITTNIKFETLAEDFRMVIAKGNIITREVQSTNEKWYQVVTMPYIRQAGNKQVGAIITFNDITGQKRVQEELDENNKSLMQINADLHNFVYLASHDLMAPMLNIEGLINILKSKTKADDPELVKLTNMINTSIAKFKLVIKDLGEIGKIEGELNNEFNKINFLELFEDIRLSMLDQVTSTNTKFITDFQEVEIKFAKMNLRSLLYNLISNAIKYKSPERDPEITIRTESIPGFLLLTISDNGMGIEADQLDNIFILYKRLGQKIDGQGIGLFLVKKIIESAGGKINVESEFGKGTKFKVYFKIDINKDPEGTNLKAKHVVMQ